MDIYAIGGWINTVRASRDLCVQCDERSFSDIDIENARRYLTDDFIELRTIGADVRDDPLVWRWFDVVVGSRVAHDAVGNECIARIREE